MPRSLLKRVRAGALKVARSVGHASLPVILAFPFLVFLYLKATNPPYTATLTGDGDVSHQPWAGLPIDYVSLQWFAILSSVVFFGALGSTVSFFSRHTFPHGEAPKISRSRSLIGAQIFGAVFATILMFAFLSGLIRGSLFPEWYAHSWIELRMRVPDWAKLMVWSFIAGFSERFVPDLLDNLILRSGKSDDEKRRDAE